MNELPHAIEYDGQPVCWCGTNHNEATPPGELDGVVEAARFARQWREEGHVESDDDPTFVVSRRDATDLTIEGSPRALIRDGRPDDAHPGYQADDDPSGLPPTPGSLRDIAGQG